MKIKIYQFLATNHSWAICGQNIARALIKLGHTVHLKSTNGYEFFPKDLEPYLVNSFDKEYDLQISYTAPINFQYYLANGSSNRIGMFNYETTVLPFGFAKHHKYVDKLSPASKFAADVFINNGVPKEKIAIIPHGVNLREYKTQDIYPLKTNKKIRIFSNIAQPHIRKNIDGLFEVYGQAFTKEDDVCLVCKINAKKISKPPKAKTLRGIRKLEKKKEEDKEKVHQFDVDFWSIYNSFLKKYPNHGEVELITDFLPSMVPLYNAIDITFSMTRAECFWIPGLESFCISLNESENVRGNIVVAPNYGGQLDYMNKDNSLLIEGKVIRAPKELQYWTASVQAEMYEPDIKDGVDKLRYAVENRDELYEKFKPGMIDTVNRLTWDNVAKMFLDLAE